jgi:hypothetical protein
MYNIERNDHDAPWAIEKWGWQYHHLGLPTNEKKPGERYLPQLKLYVSGFNTCPFGIEWMRFDQDSPITELIRTVPHIAFTVEDLDKELRAHDLKIISEPAAPSAGVRAAMIEYNGVPIELIEFKLNIETGF